MSNTRRSRREHPFFKFGKKPARDDPNDLEFRSVLRAKVDVPDEYDVDLEHGRVPTPQFLNDELSNCVIAGRAHQTLRFELREQGKLIKITNAEVRNEYFEQTGGSDDGLEVAASLKDWRKDGWIAGRRRLRIHSYAKLARRASEIKQAVYLDVGCGIGLCLPASAEKEMDSGKPWKKTTDEPSTWEDHYVYVCGYTQSGPVCVTWGRKQAMTWAFFSKYCDEAFAIIDDVESSKVKKFLDIEAIDSFLGRLGE